MAPRTPIPHNHPSKLNKNKKDGDLGLGGDLRGRGGEEGGRLEAEGDAIEAAVIRVPIAEPRRGSFPCHEGFGRRRRRRRHDRGEDR